VLEGEHVRLEVEASHDVPLMPVPDANRVDRSDVHVNVGLTIRRRPRIEILVIMFQAVPQPPILEEMPRRRKAELITQSFRTRPCSVLSLCIARPARIKHQGHVSVVNEEAM